jgi:hypothetical protein
MDVRPKASFLVPLLALGMTLATVATVRAQNRPYERRQDSQTSLTITFGSRPHWVGVPGTSVREIRQGDRTDYDMFRYGRTYYAYNSANDRWYASRGWRGEFVMIDDRSVPQELRRIPRNHWRNYPVSWDRRNHWDRRYRDRDQGDRGYQSRDDRSGYYNDRSGYDQGRDNQGPGTSATLQIRLGSPHWTGVSGTRVDMVPDYERQNYDAFRCGGAYYVYDGDRWYSSPRESGPFTMIDDRSVPTELSRVPRDQWRHYPMAWDQSDNGQDDHRGGYHSRGRGGN